MESDPIHVLSVSGNEFHKAIVKRENFFDVVKTSRAFKNNSNDSKYGYACFQVV